MAKTVLITGASGFIAAHTVNAFLRQGYHVRGAVRSERSAAEVKATHKEYATQLSLVIVPDITAPNAFDDAVKGVDGVIHTASPFILNAKDYEKELLEPAIKGTTSILQSIQEHNPQVKRVVVTASFADVLDPTKGVRSGYVYTEDDWNPVTLETATANPVVAYLASKTFAEQAAFNYVKNNKPNFDVTTLLPPMVYGPISHHVSDMSKLNTSSADIYRLINGSETTVPDTSFWAFADVHDVADMHVQAFETPEAAGQRYLISTSAYSYQMVVDILRHHFPELNDKIPMGEAGAALPHVYQLDTSKAARELGFRGTSLEKTIVDATKSFLRSEKAM